MKSACLRFFALFLVVAIAALTAPLAAQPVPAGPELPLKAATQPDAEELAVAAAADGGFLALWNSPEWSIQARAFLADGSPMEPVELRSAPGLLIETGGVHPKAAALTGGGYVAVWENENPNILAGPQTPLPGSLVNTLSIRLLDASGQPTTAETMVAEGVVASAVAADPSGGFLLVWTGNVVGVAAQRFDAQGHPSGGQMSLDGGGLSDVAVLPDGSIALVWAQGPANHTQVLLRVFGADGAPRGAAVPVHSDGTLNQASPRVAADVAGRLVVVWEAGLPTPGNPPNVLARRVGSDGASLGPELAVSAGGSSQSSGAADVSMRPDGSFLIVWPSLDGKVLGRSFLVDGTPEGAAFPVSTRPGTKARPVVASTLSSWIAVWIEGGASGGAPYGRVLRSTACSGLCLRGGRFRAEVAWRVPGIAADGAGSPLPQTDDTGAFWFFAPENYELLVKVLDGRGINGHYWVFYGALTDVEFDLTVTDLATGQRRTYHNPAGTLASQADTVAF